MNNQAYSNLKPHARQITAFDYSAPIFLFLSFFRFYIDDYNVFITLTIIQAATGWAFLILSATRQPTRPDILALVAIFTISSLVVSISNRNLQLDSLPMFIANIGFAWAIINSRLPVKLLGFALAIIITFFLLHAFMRSNPEDIFTVSRNYISIIMIVFVSLYFFACQQNSKTPSLLAMCLVMAIMLWAIGRSGIISGGIILIGSILISAKRPAMAVIITGAAFIFYITAPSFFNNYLDLFTVGIDRFERLSTYSEREIINREYLSYATSGAAAMIFGVPLSQIPIIHLLGGNPHNAFINLHVSFGLVGVVAFAMSATTSALSLIKAHKYYIFLILFVAIFRSAFDSTAFHGPMDVIIFYCIFTGMSLKQRNIET